MIQPELGSASAHVHLWYLFLPYMNKMICTLIHLQSKYALEALVCCSTIRAWHGKEHPIFCRVKSKLQSNFYEAAS